MSFAHCGGVDWHTQLLSAGATDCFANTNYEHAGAPKLPEKPGPKDIIHTLFCSCSLRYPAAVCLVLWVIDEALAAEAHRRHAG